MTLRLWQMTKIAEEGGQDTWLSKRATTLLLEARETGEVEKTAHNELFILELVSKGCLRKKEGLIFQLAKWEPSHDRRV